jgi:hypothetical protein
MKIVELLIDENESLAGGDAIALVEHPAHESDFYAFSADNILFKEDNNTIVLTEEQSDKVLMEFEKVGESHKNFLSKGYVVKDIKAVGNMNVNLLKETFGSVSVGRSYSPDSNKMGRSLLDYEDGMGKYKVRFRYVNRPGRPAVLPTSRKFCRKMMDYDRVYSFEQIDNTIKNGFQDTYPGTWGDCFFKFGGPNCGHIWIMVTYQEVFRDDEKTLKQVSQENRGKKAQEAGSNMNEKTLNNPSPRTIKNAGVGQFSEELTFTPLDKETFKKEQNKKQLLAGPVLIPDKLIFRREPITGGEYYVYFSKETTEKIAYKYMKDKYVSNANIEHNPKEPLKNTTLVESWLITDPETDKSKQYGYTLPVGTWFGIMRIEDKAEYEKYVESGIVKGFSLEGYFSSKLVQFYDTKLGYDEYILNEIVKLLND